MKTPEMKVPALLLAVAITFGAFAERVPVWPEGKMPYAQNHQIAAMTDEAGQPGFKADEHRWPYLEWFAPPAEEVANGGVVMLVSGGSYQCCCDVGLIKDWNEKLTGIGFQCVNFVYRTPRPEGLPIYQTAWADGQRAVRLVREEAAKRGLDVKRVGVFGMSAGSHLTLLLATSSTTNAYEKVDELDEKPCNIDFAITGAIAYAADDGIGVPNSRGGYAIDVKLDKCFLFDEKTAPICMLHGGLDPYSPASSTLTYREYRKKKVPAELHLYSDRWHGGFWQDNWWESVQGFLRQMNYDNRLAANWTTIYKQTPDDLDRAKYEKYDLWPEGKMPDAQAHQCTPYIEWHTPTNLTTKAIQIIYSGGSYNGNGTDSFEVMPMRRFLNRKGMTVVTMKYRTPRPKGLAKHTTAWQDLQRCIRVVRSEAAKRGLDPDRIGIMGSSAGGHLTMMGVTSSMSQSYSPIDDIDKIPCNVQWGIAIYPAYGLTDGAEAPNARGGNFDDALLVPEFVFDSQTCPVVFMHGDADGWAAMNSVKAWEKMRQMGIQSDLHTFATREHCFQARPTEGTGSWTWMNRAWEFLTHKGFNK